MKQFILILGGARSGKSSHAVQLAKEFSAEGGPASGGKKPVAFIATAASLDREMKKRIKLHKASRPRTWKLVEEGRDVGLALSKLPDKYKVVLIDCLGLLVSNLLMSNLKDGQIEKKIKNLIEVILKANCVVILVSNEVGAGIVPENALARRFRDLLGLANQMLAKKADQVILMQAGIPVNIKGN